MKKAVKKTAQKRPVANEFRPYRVLFLIVLISVACLVAFALLGVTSEL